MGSLEIADLVDPTPIVQGKSANVGFVKPRGGPDQMEDPDTLWIVIKGFQSILARAKETPPSRFQRTAILFKALWVAPEKPRHIRKENSKLNFTNRILTTEIPDSEWVLCFTRRA